MGYCINFKYPYPPPPTPPLVEELPFLFTCEDWLKLHSPLKNFVKIKASPQTNFIFFYSAPKEILNFYNSPLENSMVPHERGGRGRILNAIAQYLNYHTNPYYLQSFIFTTILRITFLLEDYSTYRIFCLSICCPSID